MIPPAAWLRAESAEAPERLLARAESYLGQAPPGLGRAESMAAAAGIALRNTLAHEGDRSTALDLLAADALVTLALLAKAQDAPAELAAFAARLRNTGAGTA